VPDRLPRKKRSPSDTNRETTYSRFLWRRIMKAKRMRMIGGCYEKFRS
jgi:hypothetical protein